MSESGFAEGDEFGGFATDDDGCMVKGREVYEDNDLSDKKEPKNFVIIETVTGPTMILSCRMVERVDDEGFSRHINEFG